MEKSTLPQIEGTVLPSRDNAQWAQAADTALTPNYGPRRLTIVRGQGTRVWDADGREYLDFFSGISVNNLGHCHPRITEAIATQAATLVHCSNLYLNPWQVELARRLVEHSFADRVFFGNSGAEANEAAIKIARRHQRLTHGPGRHEIICFEGSFHGRTLATLTATGQQKVKDGFDPLPEGFVHARFNDLESVRATIGPRTGAIMVEPIQGEGGVNPATDEFLRGLRALCDEHGLLLIFDEVQCGLGRAGALWCHQLYGVEPDIMSIGKSLGGGLAMGAMLCREPIVQAFSAGTHGSTMGGNALTAAAALAYFSELTEGEWPRAAERAGTRMLEGLRGALAGMDEVVAVRGRGLMLGIQLTRPAADVVLACEREGLIVGLAGPQVVRLLPPLTVSDEEIDRATSILAGAITAT